MLQRILLKNNKKPLFIAVNEFRVNFGYELPITTVRKYEFKCGLRNYAAVSEPCLMARHVLGRKRWAKRHLNWDLSLSEKVAFFDESNCTIKPTVLRQRVWRKQVERYKTSNLIRTFKSGYKSISVWTTFSDNGRTPLIRI